MKYRTLDERARTKLLGLLVRYAEQTKYKPLERAARAIIDSLLIKK